MLSSTQTENVGTPDKMQVLLKLGGLNPYPVVSVGWIISQIEIPLRFQEYPVYMVLKVFRCILGIAVDMIRSGASGKNREPLSSTEFLDGLDVFVCCENGVSSLIVEWEKTTLTTEIILDDVQRIVNALERKMSEFLRNETPEKQKGSSHVSGTVSNE